MLKRVKNNIQTVIENLPKNSDIFVFGSFLTDINPSDLDVLVVYDEVFCSPKIAYREIKPIMYQLEQVFGHKVDLTLLTKNEEICVNFIQKERCQRLNDILLW